MKKLLILAIMLMTMTVGCKSVDLEPLSTVTFPEFEVSVKSCRTTSDAILDDMQSGDIVVLYHMEHVSEGIGRLLSIDHTMAESLPENVYMTAVLVKYGDELDGMVAEYESETFREDETYIKSLCSDMAIQFAQQVVSKYGALR